MKRDVTRYLLIGLALILFLRCMSNAQEPPQWGEVTDGLRLSLMVDYGRHELTFSIENVSTYTQVVDLGFNGIPVALAVTFTSKDGKFRGGELGMSKWNGCDGGGHSSKHSGNTADVYVHDSARYR